MVPVGCHSKPNSRGSVDRQLVNERTVLPQVGLLAGVIFVRAKQLEAPVPATAPKAVKPEPLLKSVSPK